MGECEAGAEQRLFWAGVLSVFLKQEWCGATEAFASDTCRGLSAGRQGLGGRAWLGCGQGIGTKVA